MKVGSHASASYHKFPEHSPEVLLCLTLLPYSKAANFTPEAKSCPW